MKIYSQLENCNTYKPWTDKTTGKTYFKPDKTKRLHYYFYFIDKSLGLCFVKVPTVEPFVTTVYFNGHSWLEKKLQKENIAYQKIENAFTYIDSISHVEHTLDIVFKK